MSDSADKALLPAGMSDVLPPDADFEAKTVERLMDSFNLRGYQRVKPPLLEFEASLLIGEGSDVERETFRLMDPVSQRMMGLRPDITLQVARIAATRLLKAPRPLRLSYAGQVLRVMGSQLRPERQFGQVGAELIGSDSPSAAAEVIAMSVEALSALGVAELSVDLGLPTLVPAVCADLALDDDQQAQVRAVLDRKDDAGVAALSAILGPSVTETLGAMLKASGPAEVALDALASLALPKNAATERDSLRSVADQVRVLVPNLNLTVDAVENRGFEYQSGVTFTLFAGGVRGELGRGGCYRASRHGDGSEPATGFSLFMDTVLRALPSAAESRRVFVPAGSPKDDAARLRGEGWITVEGLEETADREAEARRLNCSHLLDGGTAREINSSGGGKA